MTYKQRSDKVIAQGCGTYSKRADQFIEGVYPTHCIGGGGGYIYGSNEVHYLDFVNALGSNLRGHQNNHSIPHTVEVEVAELIVHKIKCIDKLKFLKTGSEACSAAVRIARAFTGWEFGFGVGYHGWHNSFIEQENPGKGCVNEEYQKCADLEDLIDHLIGDETIAYVIIEPVQLSIGVQAELQEIRRLCTKQGIVLIFDEIITGFRVPHYTISNWWGIQPDLICLGKALGNGFPLAVVGGRKEIMDTPGYFISSTHSGEVSALQAAKKNIVEVTPKRLKLMWELGKWFRSEFNKFSPDLQLVGYATRAELRGNSRDLFCQEMLKKGYFFGKAWFMNFAFTKIVLEKVLRDAEQTLSEIRRGMIVLEGKPMQEVFKRNE